MLRSFFIFFVLSFASFSDIKTMEIPDWCFVSILIAAQNPKPIVFCSVILTYGIIVLICCVFQKNIPMGFGDIKIFAAIGFVYGSEFMIFVCCSSALICGAYCLVRFCISKQKREFLKKQIPYMPFILLGFILCTIRSFL